MTENINKTESMVNDAGENLNKDYAIIITSVIGITFWIMLLWGMG